LEEPDSRHRSDVVVIGGGVIGLSIAWRVARTGVSVTVVDPTPGQGASWVAAGMLAPVTEAHYREEAVLRLNLASAERYPSFVADLEDATGLPVGYRACGTLAVAYDGDDKARLDDLHAFQRRLDLKSEPLSPSECRRLEPVLAPRLRGGLLVHGDHQVDPRRLVTALLAAAEGLGVAVWKTAATSLDVRAGRVRGVTLAGGTRLGAGAVVLASGCWSAGVGGLPPAAVPPVRPVKGQIIRLRAPLEPPVLSRTVRALVRGSDVYLVPRTDGEMVVGATVEDKGFDVTVTAGAVHDLLRDAWLLVPEVAELELVEARAGLRPASPDNAPIIGAAPGVEGLVVATGHYRNGVLLTPVTADTVTELIVGGHCPDLLRPFGPGRFACA
jgi:glycine oxidase